MKHIVVQGESIPGIAFEAGLFPDTIWNHPANAALKALRKDMNVLFPGDEIFLPEKAARVETVSTGKMHAFRRLGVPCLLRLQLFNVETARANEAFCLTVDGVEQRGIADDCGVLELWVAPNARQGVLTVGPDQKRIDLQFGHMDPLDEKSGLRKRMVNLGYLEIDADADATRRALLSLQRRFGLSQSGDFDAPTRDLLANFHDSDNLFPADLWLSKP